MLLHGAHFEKHEPSIEEKVRIHLQPQKTKLDFILGTRGQTAEWSFDINSTHLSMSLIVIIFLKLVLLFRIIFL